MIKDYLDLPEQIERAGAVYPIPIIHWEEFSRIARHFLFYSYDFLKYRCKLESDIKLFDFLFALILQNEEEEVRVKLLSDFQKMIGLTFRRATRSMFNPNTGEWVFQILEGEEVIGTLDRDNFDDYKTAVMRQNLLFEPLIVESEITQQIIDDAIERMSRKGTPPDLEAMIIAVSVAKGMRPSDFQSYTYYQLRADYEISQRKELNGYIHLYRSQGAKTDPIDLLSKLEIHENPYSFEKLFNKVDAKKEQKLQEMMSGS